MADNDYQEDAMDVDSESKSYDGSDVALADNAHQGDTMDVDSESNTLDRSGAQGEPKKEEEEEKNEAEKGKEKEKEEQEEEEKEKRRFSRVAGWAVINGDFVWAEKPEPYATTLTSDESEGLEACERRIHQELLEEYEKATKQGLPGMEDEIEVAEFLWRDRPIVWEKLLKVDWDDGKNRYKNSSLKSKFDEKLDAVIEGRPQASDKARKMRLAEHYHNLGKDAWNTGPKSNPKTGPKFKEPKMHLRQVDVELYGQEDAMNQKYWAELESKYNELIDGEGKAKPVVEEEDQEEDQEGEGKGKDADEDEEEDEDEYDEREEGEKGDEEGGTHSGNSESSGSLHEKLELLTDSVFENAKNKIAASGSGILRSTPKDKTYVVDKNGKLIVFLIPEALQDAFQNRAWVKTRMETDTRHLYTHIKRPHVKGKQDKRHSSQSDSKAKHGKGQSSQLSQPARKYGFSGTEHYGCWHAKGQEPGDRSSGAIIETSDSLNNSSEVRQAILHFLENTGGTMTKLIDFWFGVWDHDLREQYRDIYENSPKFARLPPTNTDRRETWTLRVVIVNRETTAHTDDRDWKGGLTGLVQIGKFTGAEMCLKELGIQLGGYNSGAMLLFRGTDIQHYTAPFDWENQQRYAFDHFTHESVRRVVSNKGKYKPYEEPEFPEKDQEIKHEEASVDTKPTKNTKGKSKTSKGKKKEAPARKPRKAPAKKSQKQQPHAESVDAKRKTTGKEKETPSKGTRKATLKRSREQDIDDENDKVVEEPKPKRRNRKADSDQGYRGTASSSPPGSGSLRRSERKKTP